MARKSLIPEDKAPRTKTKVAKESPRLSTDQKRYILDRLTKASWYQIRAKVIANPPDPAEVRKAWRVIDAHKRARHRREEALHRKHQALYDAVKHAVYFGTPQTALRALEALENFWTKDNRARARKTRRG